ncbi:hypothetical protein RZS08_52060, partial [Arthrospira platensis SPKY1]|nr:hypothetical protein [Arthrospira platensis SPKY1]
MDFQLKTLTPHQAVAVAADALVLLWPTQDPKTRGTDPLSVWAQSALREGDVEPSAGKTLSAHRLPGIKPRRVVLAPVQEGSSIQVRRAMQAAVVALKGA